jgi:hypothetical protein
MRNALLVVAAVFVAVGAFLIYPPAGVILAGLVLGAFVLLTD